MRSKWTYLLGLLILSTVVFVLYATQKDFDDAEMALPSNTATASGDAAMTGEEKAASLDADNEALGQADGPSPATPLSAEASPPSREEIMRAIAERQRQRAIEEGRLAEFEAREAWREKWEEARKLKGEEKIKAIRELRIEMKRQRAIETGRYQEFAEWEQRMRQREAEREQRRLEREKMQEEEKSEESPGD